VAPFWSSRLNVVQNILSILIAVGQQLAVCSSTQYYCRFQTAFLYRSGAYKICRSPEHCSVARFRLKSDRRVAFFFLSKQTIFRFSCLPVFIHCRELCIRELGSSGSVLNLDHQRSCAVIFLILTPRQTNFLSLVFPRNLR
jgi:hypothetical protein